MRITKEEYEKAKAIVAQYEMEQLDKHRFCKGCQSEVSKTMYCHCGDFPLSESNTYTAQELSELDIYQ